MNYLKSLSILLSCTFVLTACQQKSATKANADDNNFQCISATIMVGGKPITTVIQWNAKTGVTRLIDSVAMISKVTGAQNTLVGWVPLGDLNTAVQEAVAREQAVQQRMGVSPALRAPVGNVAPATSAKPVSSVPGKGRK
ncbi:MAG: hypothetical protein A3F67_06080 [Verrucomicrobia bacterium RIFCSPHIGHO2_12_FULL_41_10]|nr:MAG: hypothetical protein A3F67_06080 [Verrucomicrobia bacterium RIFCSPHIGHO2_12_FULL_41_10]